MPSETTKLTINIDINQASTKARRLATELKALGTAGGAAGRGISTGMMQATQGINMAGDASAAAAIKFQTATQGMLNLSTTGIQTFTSISNLARAENRAAASLVGKQRAQDALNRFQIKYNRLLETGSASTRDLTQAQNELNTAMEDYAVKADKADIEMQAVLDIQLLFFANIMNVGVSTMQVMGSMLGANTKAMIVNTLHTKLNSISRLNNSHVIGGNIIAKRIDTLATTTNSIGIKISTTSIRLQTIALKGLRIALGPIGLIFIGISAAMVAYETNLGGVKDTINGLLGIQDDLGDSLLETKGAADDFTNALEGMDSTAKKIPNTFAKMREEVIKARNDFVKLNAEANTFVFTQQQMQQQNRAMEANNLISGGFLSASQRGQEPETKGSLTSFITFKREGVPQFLTGFLAEQRAKGTLRGSIFDPDFRPKSTFNLEQFALDMVKRDKTVQDAITFDRLMTDIGFPAENFFALSKPAQDKLREEVVRAGTFEELLRNPTTMGNIMKALNEQEVAAGRPQRNFLTFPNAANILNRSGTFRDGTPIGLAGETFVFRDFAKLAFLPKEDKERFIPSLISRLLATGQGHLVRQLDPKKQRNFILNGEALNPLLGSLIGKARATSAGKGIFSTDLAGIKIGKKSTIGQLIRLIAFDASKTLAKDVGHNAAATFLRRIGIDETFITENGTPNVIIPKDVKQTLDKIVLSGSVVRTEVFLSTGVDIGSVADSLSRDDAFRIGHLEANLRSGAFLRDPANLIAAGILNESGFEFQGTTLVGDSTGLNQNPFTAGFKIKGRMLTVNLKGKIITLPMGKETFDAMNAVATQSGVTMAHLLRSQADFVRGTDFNRDRIMEFGTSFMKQFNFSTPNVVQGSVFSGVSATAAFQSTSPVDNVAMFAAAVRRKEYITSRNNGQVYAAFRLRQFVSGKSLGSFTLGRTESQSTIVKSISKTLRQNAQLRGNFALFRDLIPDLPQLLVDAGLDSPKLLRKLQSAFDAFNNSSSLRGAFSNANELLKFLNPIFKEVGIDLDLSGKAISSRLTSGVFSPFGFQGGKSKNFFRRFTFGPDLDEQLRVDLGIKDDSIIIPKIGIDLLNDVAVFSANKFTDFDDMDIVNRTLEGTGLTKQEIYDRRFNTTRGDRELENILRFNQRLGAISSGVSTL